jgi:hypothetical protein
MLVEALAGAFARLGNIGSSSALFDVLLPAILRVVGFFSAEAKSCCEFMSV